MFSSFIYSRAVLTSEVGLVVFAVALWSLIRLGRRGLRVRLTWHRPAARLTTTPLVTPATAQKPAVASPIEAAARVAAPAADTYAARVAAEPRLMLRRPRIWV